MKASTYDAIVVGLGAMGSATLFHLARRGLHVLGLDQFHRGHTFGSSHGDSRISRETYFEHPLYVPLVQRAHQLWRQLEQLSGLPLMKLTGGLMIGPRDGMVVSGPLRSASQHNLPHEVLSPAQVHDRFPAFKLAPHLTAVLDPRAGFLDPEACNRAHLHSAAAAGAEARFEEPVLEWNAHRHRVRVTTPNAVYFAKRLVLTAGPWTRSLTRGVDLPLSVERQSVFWFADEGLGDAYHAAHFPIYASEFKPGTICYGFPSLVRGMKASVMHDGATVTNP